MWGILDMLFPPGDDDIALRRVSDDEFLSFVRPQLVPVTRPATIAFLSFGEPSVRAAVHEMKYHGSERAFTLLSIVLSEYLRDGDTGLTKPVLIPVPLGGKRRKERGFNQIEEVCRRIAKECNVEMDTSLLTRTRETVSQVSLPRRKREENMHGAFRATRPVDADRTYMIIDDVTTTGATLQACIDALTDAGAEHVIPLALAH